MENIQPIGNPITLLLERIAYVLIGCFFIVAFFSGLQRGRQDHE